MKSMPVSTKILPIIGGALALCLCLAAWLIVRFFNSEAHSAFENHLYDIALISCEMDHQTTAKLCKNNNMLFHRIIPVDNSDEVDISAFGESNDLKIAGVIDPGLGKKVYNNFQSDPSKISLIKEVNTYGNRHAIAFVPARVNESCVSCHDAVGLSLAGKQSELVGVFGVSASIEDLYKREQTFLIICVLGTLILVSVLGLLIYMVISKLNEVAKRTRIMLDAAPFGSIFWKDDFTNIDCNLEVLRLFDFSDKKTDFLINFFSLSPEFQPDGTSSKDKAAAMINMALSKGRHVFEWQHQKLDGELIPSEMTLVRVDADKDEEKVVIGYIRDLREIREKAEKLDVAEKMAFTDALTGIFNRRYFLQYATNEFIAQQKDASSIIGIIMLDIDHFKKINDTYGHEAGDEALKLATRTIQSALRDLDLLARFGGEEFVVLVKTQDNDAINNLAWRICKKIEDIEFFYEGTRILITISAGVAIRKNLTHTIEEVIKQADQALYQAKSNGRNRVEVFINSD